MGVHGALEGAYGEEVGDVELGGGRHDGCCALKVCPSLGPFIREIPNGSVEHRLRTRPRWDNSLAGDSENLRGEGAGAEFSYPQNRRLAAMQVRPTGVSLRARGRIHLLLTKDQNTDFGNECVVY